MRFPRTIRRDSADVRRFDLAADSGEWAVTGAFRFAHRDPARFRGKELHAFKHAWFGLSTFGSASLVEVAEISEPLHDTMMRRLAAYFVAHCGVSELHDAIEAAEQEMVFAAGLCSHPLGTVLMLAREFNEQGLIEIAQVVDLAG